MDRKGYGVDKEDSARDELLEGERGIRIKREIRFRLVDLT